MRVHRFIVASALSVALIALQGSAQAQMADTMRYCRADVARLCPGVPMGGGHILRCLKEHKMEMSGGCAQGLQKMKAQMGN
jgi:Cysteine rich repeat